MKAEAQPIDSVLSALGVERTAATQYSVRCPAHEDNTASLSVGVREDGVVGLCCHAGCGSRAVCAALGIDFDDLFPHGKRQRAKPKARKAKAAPAPNPTTVADLSPDDWRAATDAAKRLGPSSLTGYRLAALYPYRRANGKTWGWRARYESKNAPKQIKPFHHDGTGWVLKEAPPPSEGKPLYRLPELLAADGPVFIVEGEKCADALAALGIAATTSGAAKSAVKADWSSIAGRTCVIWPDNDDPGEQYAAGVARILLDEGCNVTIIDLDAAGITDEHADAADWLQATPNAAAADVLALPTTVPEQDANPADALFDNLTPLSPAVWAAADTPHLHMFQQGHVGIFPVGEVTVIGSPGRTGKTTILVAMASRHLLGESLGGLPPTQHGPIVVLSAEDTPTQFARKLSGAKHFIRSQDWSKVEQGFFVPDFDSPALAELRQLVSLDRGQPVVAPQVETIIEALRRLKATTGIGAIFIETASTWNAANEDNPSFRALIAAAKQIARLLNVAVVLTHHVSQSSGQNLSKLDLSVADLRGGTTFVDNSRQVALLVNLGSDDNPFPNEDARTVLRRMAAPNVTGKLSTLVLLNSSQGDDVPPLFFEWVGTEHGPFCREVVPAPVLRDRKWYAVRELVKQARPQKVASDKAAKLEEVVEIVRVMDQLRKAGGKPATARAVSQHAGRSDTWATEALKEAVKQGVLTCSKEQVPRVKGKADVYRPANA